MADFSRRPGDRLFIIQEGRVKVTKAVFNDRDELQGHTQLGIMEDNACFGEKSLVESGPRTGQEKGATLANFKPLVSRSCSTRFGWVFDERSSLGTVSKREWFFLERARAAHPR